jgi:hypothetical protein
MVTGIWLHPIWEDKSNSNKYKQSVISMPNPNHTSTSSSITIQNLILMLTK